MNLKKTNLSTSIIVVTFNRLDYLKKCLSGIEAQDFKFDNLIIVNNASSDGTEAWLVQNGFVDFVNNHYLRDGVAQHSKVSRGNYDITYLRLSENEGGSGGFNEGVKTAYDLGSEWIWIMDDDVSPDPNCLSQLHNEKGEAICIHPLKIFENGDEQVWEGKFDPSKGEIFFLDNNKSFKEGKSCEVNYACFEGALFHRRAVDLVGLPDKRFFIAFDDRIWGYLLSKHGKILFTREAILRKLIDSRRGALTGFQLYFKLRNYFLVDRVLSENFGTSLSRKIYRLKVFIKFNLRVKADLRKFVKMAFRDGRSSNFYKGSFFN